ncbi:MAG: phage tail tape measure protein [Prevotellaceae bacterium]|jgi:TP901 family phage tail tape measure protein|nr:phage tail tape measure protein [Prevotellaceae bacterium]
MAEKIAKRGISLYIDGRQVTNSVKDIRAEMRTLINAQAKMKIGSDEYIATAKRIAQLKAIYQEHIEKQKQVDRQYSKMGNSADEYNRKKERAFSMSKMADGFNKYFGMITALVASLTGITLGARKAVDEFAKLEESEADVMKYTGLAKEEIKGLGEELKKWDTRTSRIELNALIADAGRLGKKSKQDLLDFAEAGNIINVALGEDLGEDAIKNIGKLSIMFGNADSLGLKEAMLATGSAINEVAQNSSAAEPFLVNFANRLAGIGNQAGMSISQIIGLGSVLDQNAQQVEMSSTALSGLMMKLYKDPAKFAKIAGLEVKQFAELLRKDANEALLTLLDTLGKKGGLADLAPIFDEMKLDGARASNVLSVLAGNIEQIRKEQETATQAFNEGTSVINEYNVKNNTLQATIEKAKKKFQELVYELGEKLAPHMRKFISTGGLMVKTLSAITGFLMNHGKQLLAVIATLTSYTIALKLHELWLNRVTIGTKALHAANVLLKGGLSALQILFYALTGQMAKATAAMRIFNVIFKANPLGFVVAAITAIVSGLILLYQKLKANADQMKEYMVTVKQIHEETKKYTEGLTREQTAFSALIGAIVGANENSELRKQLIQQLKKEYPKYIDYIDSEKISNSQLLAILREVNSEYEKRYTISAYKGKADAQSKKVEEAKSRQIDITEEIRELNEGGLTGPEGVQVAKLQDEYKQLDRIISAGIKKISEYNTQATNLQKDLDFEGSYEGVAVALDKVVKTIQRIKERDLGAIEALVGKDSPQYKTKLKELKDLEAEADVLSDKLTFLWDKKANQNNSETATSPGAPTTSTNSTEDESLKKQMATIEKEAAIRRIAAMQTIQDKKLLEDELLKIERETIVAKMAIYKNGSDEYVKLEEELAKFDLKATRDKEKLVEDREKAILALEKKYRKAAIQTDAQKKEEALRVLDETWGEEVRTTERYLKLKQAIIDQYDPVRKGNIEAAKQLISDNPEATNKKRDLRSMLSNDKLSSGAKDDLINSSEEAELAQLDALQSLHDAEIDSILNYEELRLSIEGKYKDLREANDEEEFKRKVQLAQFAIEQMNVLLSAYSGYVQASQDAETAAVEAKYDKQIKAAGNNQKKVEKLEKQKEEELAKVRAEYEDKSFAIQIAQAIASTAMAAINAYSSAAAIPVVGPVLAPIAAGVATVAGMIQVATIKKQHEAAKANYDTGGFTPSGPWNRPQGVVHSDEFVANRFATGNPMLRPVFDVIDYAQRNNTIHSLEKKDIARALGIKGFDTGGYVNQTMVNNNSPVIDPGYFEALIAVIDRLDKKLEEPFVGEVSITGQRGIKENMDLYNRMINNASRS